MAKWLDLMRDMFASYDTVTVSIVGIMRTGKTNIAKHLVRKFLYGWGKDGIGYYVQDRYIEALDKIFKLEKKAKHQAIALILDDLTYHIESRDAELGNRIAKIKHYLPHAKKVLVITIFHYIASVMPFLRLTMVRVLTSIMTQWEIDAMKPYFNLDSLHDFYSLKSSDPITYRFYALINVMGLHSILDVEKYPYREDPWVLMKLKKKAEKIPILIKYRHVTPQMRKDTVLLTTYINGVHKVLVSIKRPNRNYEFVLKKFERD